MFRTVSSPLLGLLILLAAGGCRLCCNDGDADYAAYGGDWQRTQRGDGRVASLYAPAGARGSTLTSRDQPVDDGPSVRDAEDDADTEAGESLEDEPMDLDAGLDEDVDDDLEPAPDADDLRELDLEDLEDEATDKLKDLDLEDIEVKIIPRSGGSIY